MNTRATLQTQTKGHSLSRIEENVLSRVPSGGFRAKGGVALAGHGFYDPSDGYTTIPPGIRFHKFSPPGSQIVEFLATKIEAGQGLHPNQYHEVIDGDKPNNNNNLTENTILEPDTPLSRPLFYNRQAPRKITVNEPTLLSELLEKINTMKASGELDRSRTTDVYWAACQLDHCSENADFAYYPNGIKDLKNNTFTPYDNTQR